MRYCNSNGPGKVLNYVKDITDDPEAEKYTRDCWGVSGAYTPSPSRNAKNVPK